MIEFFKKNYLIITLIIYLILNLFFKNYYIRGILYIISMLLLTFLNYKFVKNNLNEINHSKVILILLFSSIFLAKNIFYVIFNLSTFLAIIRNNYKLNKYLNLFSKVIIIWAILFIFAFTVMLPFQLISFSYFIKDFLVIAPLNDQDNIYYCSNNYLLYKNDDKTYSLEKSINFPHLKWLITISYKDKQEINSKNYQDYINDYNCKLKK